MPKNVDKIYSEVSRHGRKMYYFRDGRGPKIRLPDDYGSEHFWNAHAIALGGGRPLVAKRFIRKNEGRILKSSTSLLRAARNRAVRSNRIFDLDKEWFEDCLETQRWKCALCRLPFFSGERASMRVNPYAPSIDRIDSGGGYTKENSRLVLFAINIMLNEWGEEVFSKIVEGYRGTKKQLSIPNSNGAPPTFSPNP